MAKQRNKSNNDLKVIPTRKALVTTSVFLALSTFLVIGLVAWAFNKVNSYEVRKEVKWENNTNYLLEAGPTWFAYKQKEDKLVTLRIIEDSTKAELLSLYPKDRLGFDDYKNAIEELSFATQEAPKPSYLLTLLIGGLAAVLGVQIRSIHRFVLRVCYVKDFDLSIWWPWYVMRPVMGFLLGCAIVLLAEVNLLSIQTDNPSLYFWIGLAILTGFGAPDVVDRLYMLSKTLFGTGGGAPEEESIVVSDEVQEGRVDADNGKSQPKKDRPAMERPIIKEHYID